MTSMSAFYYYHHAGPLPPIDERATDRMRRRTKKTRTPRYDPNFDLSGLYGINSHSHMFVVGGIAIFFKPGIGPHQQSKFYDMRVSLYKELMFLCWKDGTVPQDIRDANITITLALYKTKGDRSDCYHNNYHKQADMQKHDAVYVSNNCK